jgi:uncharacterized protein (TIGR00251 family)
LGNAPSPFAAAPGGVRVRVKLVPKASRNALGGVAVDADGRACVKASVTAAPEAGKANTALIALLAKTWRLPTSAISVVAGAASRRKTLLIAGDPAALIPHLARALAGAPGKE